MKVAKVTPEQVIELHAILDILLTAKHLLSII